MKKMQKNEGFTLIELLIVVAIIGIIAAIAVPGLLRARMSGNEASGIGSIRTIASAEATYASACGGGGYAVNLETLGAPPDAGGPAFIPTDLRDAKDATAPKSGYFFAITDPGGTTVLAQASVCNAKSATADSATQFFATAQPADPGSTGTRYFATDHSGMIRQDSNTLPAVITDGIPLQ